MLALQKKHGYMHPVWFKYLNSTEKLRFFFIRKFMKAETHIVLSAKIQAFGDCLKLEADIDDNIWKALIFWTKS